jgi:hypothetical protein
MKGQFPATDCRTPLDPSFLPQDRWLVVSGGVIKVGRIPVESQQTPFRIVSHDALGVLLESYSRGSAAVFGLPLYGK